MRRRFFVEQFAGGRAVLEGESAHHLGSVLRASVGQLYELSDGNSVWLARTEHIAQKRIDFTLIEQLAHDAAARLHIKLLLSIVKFDRFEWAIEKATELGVDEIVPVAAARTEKGLIAAGAKRSARWLRILSESAQQSRRLRVPALIDVVTPAKAFAASPQGALLLLSERAGARPMRELLEPRILPTETVPTESVPREAWSDAGTTASVTIAIGPEGGWTDAEFDAAREFGFVEAALGSNILRTETAVCAALAALQYAFGSSTPTLGNADAGKSRAGS